MKYSFVTVILLALSKGLSSQTSCIDSIDVVSDYDCPIGFHDGTNGANMNFGTATQNAGFWIPGTAGPVNGNRALIHFDISSIPGTAAIISARMDLYAHGALGTYNGHTGSNNSCYLQRITSSWAELTATWNNQPASVSANQVLLNASTNNMQNYLNIDVTALTADIFNSGSNNGYLLKLVNEQTTNMLIFCSEDHSNPALRPRLKVKFSTCVGIEEERDFKKYTVILPNPNKGIFTIKTNNVNPNAMMEVYNAVGQKVYETNIVMEETKVKKELCDGIYYLRFSGNGVRSGALKMIIKN